MAAYATVSDYEARAAVTLAEPTRSQVEAYLDDASALIRRAVPAGAEPDPDTARAIAVAVVRRVMANPGGYRQRSIGQYAETLGENGGLYLTDEERELLQPDTGEDPGADAAYSLDLDHGVPGWVADPAYGAGWPR